MNYYRFFILNSKILIFLVLFTFFSGFGQTFLLSIYIPHFLNDFEISRTFFSTIYSIATIFSGLSLIVAGKIIDKVKIIHFSLAVITGLIFANIFASISFNAITLFIAIYLLRFFGQGLSTHTAFTVAGKYFNKARGKALSIAYLGFPFTEGIMPIVILTCIGIFGWRTTFLLSAISILIILLPLTIYLLNKFNPINIIENYGKDKAEPTIKNNNVIAASISQKQVIKSNKFYLIALTPFLVGFIITALFFFQTFIAEYKGWTIEWMAVNISVYALASFLFSVFGGPLIDRFTARKLFPFIVIPLALGLIVIAIFSSPIVAVFYWFLVGITAGINSTVSNALYAEIYGTESLGAVRSLFTFVMIIGTALGPIVYSLLLDVGLNFSTINVFIAIAVFINVVVLCLSSKALGSN